MHFHQALPRSDLYFLSLSWSPLITAGSSPSALWEAPRVAPSRTACMASESRCVVIRLSASATALSHPFWYSNWKLNFARAPIHQWPVASKLGVVIMYVRGLLSVLTRKGWYNKYSLKCSAIWWSGSSFHGLWVPGCHRLPDKTAHLLVSGKALLPIPP